MTPTEVCRHRKISTKVIFITLYFLIFLAILVFGYNYFQEYYPLLPLQKNGVVICRGFMISGSHDQYWQLDLRDRQLTKLTDIYLTNLLDLKYNYQLANNPEDWKVKHHYELINKQFHNIYIENIASSALYAIMKPKFKSITNANEDSLTTNDGKFKVISDSKKKVIKIIDNISKNTKVVKINNSFWGNTLSPDSKYVAFFEHQPFAFNDGSTYQIRFLDLNTAKIYAIPNGQISLPGAMIWLY